MNNEEILSKVVALFATMTDADEITEESELMEDLGISSMDVLFLISGLEAEFGVKIPERDIRQVVTVSDVIDIIAERIE